MSVAKTPARDRLTQPTTKSPDALSLWVGSHLSVAGGLERAVEEAKALHFGGLQVFTRNQRVWKTPALTEDEVRAFRDACAGAVFAESGRIVSHNSYLVNLASPDVDARRKSIECERAELERCEQLGITASVAHPGAHLGTYLGAARKPKDPNDLHAEPQGDELEGLRRIAKSLDEIHAGLRGYRVRVALETTTGSGTNLGYAFRHLAIIRDLVREPDRVAFCIDTCHIVSSGYGHATEQDASATLAAFDEVCGLAHVAVMHMNDSEAPPASRRDLHAHIGHGTCGKPIFEAVMRHPKLARVPKVLETEKGDSPSGTSWDVVNAKALVAMAKSPAVVRLGTLAFCFCSMFLLAGCSASWFKRTTIAASAQPVVLRTEPTVAEEEVLVAADKAMAHADYETALRLFRDLLNDNPTLSPAYLGMGQALMAEGDPQRAETAFARAVKLTPASFQSQFGHAEVLSVLGRMTEAVGAFRRALAIRPLDFATNLALAKAYLELDQSNNALIFAQKSVEIDPMSAAAQIRLAEAFTQTGDGAGAVRAYEEAVELGEPTKELLLALVQAYGAQKRFEEAVNTAQALLMLGPDANAAERLGWARFRMGRFEEALAAYEQALTIDPDHWPSLNGVGVLKLNAWIKSEKRLDAARDDARNAFQRSLQVNGNQPKVTALLIHYRLGDDPR